MSQPMLADDFLTHPLPGFLPQRVRSACAGKRITFRIPAAVRERMQVPEDIDGAEWADKYYRVTAIDAHPGRWRGELLPHTRRALQLVSAPHVRQLWICWPERDGKTHVLTVGAQRTLDRGCESGNIFWLMPSEAEAKKAFGERLIPALKACPRTARLLSRYADDTTGARVRFRHGPRLFSAWAGSPATVSSFFGKLNIGDEIDKAETTGVGKETDILTLLFKRGRDDESSKFLFASTPAQGYIYSGTMGCQRVEEYHGRCPHCEKLVNPGEEQVVIPEGAGVEDVAHGRVPVAIVCPDCGAEWSDQDRQQACREGEWVPVKGAEVQFPETVGLHKTAYLAPKIPVKEIAAAILKARTGGETEKKALENGYNVRDFKMELKDRVEDAILRLRDKRAAGVVPSQADALEISIDTQDHGFWYRIRAWQYGLSLTSWLVKSGYLASSAPDDFTPLDALLEAEYPDENGEPHRIMAGIIDTQGHRASEVYAWCRRTGILAGAGAPGRKTQPVTVSRIDRFPGNGRPIPGGLALYSIDTHYHKDTLANKLLIDPTDPGALILHSGHTYDQLKALERDPSQKFGHNLGDYARQMCAESRDDRGLWQCPEGKANHLWDCESNGVALVQWLGWQHAVSEKGKQAPQESQKNVQSHPAGNARPGWFNNR